MSLTMAARRLDPMAFFGRETQHLPGFGCHHNRIS
jgi:hypothetical protein